MSSAQTSGACCPPCVQLSHTVPARAPFPTALPLGPNLTVHVCEGKSLCQHQAQQRRAMPDRALLLLLAREAAANRAHGCSQAWIQPRAPYACRHARGYSFVLRAYCRVCLAPRAPEGTTSAYAL
jgi:hypothetical protein